MRRLRADKDVTARNGGTPVSGRGIGVLINDSGVDGTHDDIKLGTHLVQNTLGSTNLHNLNAMLPVTYIEGVPNTDNNSGHGTHCAGTVGGNGQPVTVTVNGQKVALDDAASIPAGLEGYVSVALELNLINAYYSVTQGPFDLQPVLHATFKPSQPVTRGDFAVVVTRTFPQYSAQTQPAASSARSAAPASADAASAVPVSQETSAYPNPFSGSTTLSYYLAQDGPVSVEVYNNLGSKVRTLRVGTEAAGSHQLRFDAGDLARGSYLLRVKTGEAATTKRLVIH